MSRHQTGGTPPKRGKRHPLLFQQRLNEQIFWPSILIIGLSSALLIWNPARLEPYRSTLSLALVSTGLTLALTFLYRLRAYAQCSSDSLLIQLPFHRLTIPYTGIKTVRPTELYRMFPPEQQNWTQRSFLRGLFGETVIVVEMEQLPRSHVWLRLWMSKYMLCPERVGLVLAVRDWLAFRAQLDEFKARRRR